ncbi:MAG: glycosyltransferase family 39 protein [Verrucomicrobiota bacterium]
MTDPGKLNDNKVGPALPAREGTKPEVIVSGKYSDWRVFLGLGIIAVTLFGILLSAPPRLGQNNEDRLAEYVTDAVAHGNWICQTDALGQISSKPPMACWISSVATVVAGEINRFTLYIPSALAALLLSWIIFVVARKHFGWRAGFLGASMYLLSNVAVNEMATCRFDALFALFVMLGAAAAFQSWRSGRGWVWFWLAAAGATLTKGPLGILLSAAGLLAVFWEKGRSGPRLRGSHFPGIALYVLIAGGWFALAYWKLGHALVDKMIFQELLAHAAGKAKDRSGFYKPLLWFLTDFGPWSLLALFGIWRVIRKPAAELEERCFERFLSSWFVLGLLAFSFGGHERARLIFPIVPAAALLAGNELARLTRSLSRAKLAAGIAVGAVVMLGLVGYYYHVQRVKTFGVRENIAMRELARNLQKKFGRNISITHLDSPFPLRFYLKDFRAPASITEAATFLRGESPALIAVEDRDALTRELGSNAPPIYVVERWPARGAPRVEILSNKP